jgi:hypothetical protein
VSVIATPAWLRLSGGSLWFEEKRSLGFGRGGAGDSIRGYSRILHCGSGGTIIARYAAEMEVEESCERQNVEMQ